MWEEVVTENVHSMIGICWNLKKQEKEVFNQQFLRWLIHVSEKKTHINHEATYFRETKFSNSWGDLYQLEMIMRRIILAEKHPVIQKVINFREGWWGEGKGEVDLTQKPRILTSTNLIGWGVHNIKYCSNSSHYNFFAPK